MSSGLESGRRGWLLFGTRLPVTVRRTWKRSSRLCCFEVYLTSLLGSPATASHVVPAVQGSMFFPRGLCAASHMAMAGDRSNTRTFRACLPLILKFQEVRRKSQRGQALNRLCGCTGSEEGSEPCGKDAHGPSPGQSAGSVYPRCRLQSDRFHLLESIFPLIKDLQRALPSFLWPSLLLFPLISKHTDSDVQLAKPSLRHRTVLLGTTHILHRELGTFDPWAPAN